jgi:tripartite-type tricarboxylate transporter receptor subunit TctC
MARQECMARGYHFPKRPFAMEEDSMRRIARVLGMVAALLAGPAFAQADYPSRPVKFVIPYGPGGATDIIARYLSPRLQEMLGQPLVVENKPGASGNIALEVVAKSAADGYTLQVGNVSTNTINENAFAQTLQIKPSKDLVCITKLIEIPHVVVASGAFAPGSVTDMVKWAKGNPGKLNYASASIGSYPHLDMVKLSRAAAFEAVHIPYKGGAGQMVPALLSGEVQVAFINQSSTIEHIRSGRLKALAVTTAARNPDLPNVATLAEQGYPGIGTNAWQGVFAPAGTPKPVIDKLFAAMSSVLSRPDVKEQLLKQMMTVALSASPQECNEQVRAETQAWGDFLRENRIKVE